MYFYDLEEIKNRMKEINITPYRLSIEIGVNKMTIHNLVSGKSQLDTIQLGTYKKIIKRLWGIQP